MKKSLNQFAKAGLFWALFTLTFLPTQAWSVCGDTIIDPGEACDNGNYLDPDTATVGVFRFFDDPVLISFPADFYLTTNGELLLANLNFVTRINRSTGVAEVLISPTDGVNYTFSSLTGIVQSLDGSIFISDAGNGLIYHFDMDGNYIEENNSIGSPFDLLIHPDGRLLVASDSSDAVMSLDPNNFTDAALIFADDAQVSPRGMVIRQDGVLFVSNSASDNISAFHNLNAVMASSDGVFISSGPAGAPDELDIPINIALRPVVGEADQLCVGNAGLGNILCYLADGSFSEILLDSSSLGGGPLNAPFNLAFDENGNLWVSERLNDRLYLYILNPLNSDMEPNSCRTTCEEASCGDGVIDNGETCDDGNLIEGDGCDTTCQAEILEGPDNQLTPTPDSVSGGGCSLNPVSSTSLLPYAWFVLGLALLGWKRVRR